MNRVCVQDDKDNTKGVFGAEGLLCVLEHRHQTEAEENGVFCKYRGSLRARKLQLTVRGEDNYESKGAPCYQLEPLAPVIQFAAWAQHNYYGHTGG